MKSKQQLISECVEMQRGESVSPMALTLLADETARKVYADMSQKFTRKHLKDVRLTGSTQYNAANIALRVAMDYIRSAEPFDEAQSDSIYAQLSQVMNEAVCRHYEGLEQFFDEVPVNMEKKAITAILTGGEVPERIKSRIKWAARTLGELIYNLPKDDPKVEAATEVGINALVQHVKVHKKKTTHNSAKLAILGEMYSHYRPLRKR